MAVACPAANQRPPIFRHPEIAYMHNDSPRKRTLVTGGAGYDPSPARGAALVMTAAVCRACHCEPRRGAAVQPPLGHVALLLAMTKGGGRCDGLGMKLYIAWVSWH
jgi:hypothetical protein